MLFQAVKRAHAENNNGMDNNAEETDSSAIHMHEISNSNSTGGTRLDTTESSSLISRTDDLGTSVVFRTSIIVVIVFSIFFIAVFCRIFVPTPDVTSNCDNVTSIGLCLGRNETLRAMYSREIMKWNYL